MKASTAALLASIALPGMAVAEDVSLEGLQERIVGHWKSIACELRPQQNAADPRFHL
jgi:hypothetical protein